MAATSLKLVAVGDASCGKTCLFIVYTDHPYPEEYLPSVLDNYGKVVEIDGREIEIVLWDLRVYADYESLRPLSYPGTDVVLICFNIDSPDSLENVEEQWIPEVRKHCSDVPIILVGTKTDLRDDENVKIELRKFKEEPVKREDGEEMAKKINAVAYLECSAKNNEGVRDIFEVAARAGLEFYHSRKKEKRKKCCLL